MSEELLGLPVVEVEGFTRLDPGSVVMLRPSGLLLVETPRPSPPAPPTPAAHDPDVIEALRRSGSERTTPGMLGNSLCACCGVPMTQDTYVGGLWVRRPGQQASHELVCRACSQQYDPAWPKDADPLHDTKITVTLLDTVTGETRQSPPHPQEWTGGWSTWWWTEGNGSCDCNRRVVFEGPGSIADDHPCRSERYRVVAVEPLLPGCTLADFNDGYPPHPPEAN